MSPATSVYVIIEGKHVESNLVLEAIAIADDSEISLIECTCLTHSGDAATGWWYDTNVKESGDRSWRAELEEDDRVAVAKAVQYLERRGILLRHPTAPGVVSFRRDA